MKTPFRYAVNLNVKHPSWPSRDIAAALGMTPRYDWTAGERCVTPAGTLLSGVRGESYCAFEIGEGEDGQLASCLSDAVERLRSGREYLRDLRATGGSAMLYVFWYPGGDTGEVFAVDLLFAMSDLGIELGINVYDDGCSAWDGKTMRENGM